MLSLTKPDNITNSALWQISKVEVLFTKPVKVVIADFSDRKISRIGPSKSN